MRKETADPISISFSVLTSLLFCLFILPTFAAAQEKITIGLLPEMNVFKQMKRFEPLAEHLSARMKVKVQLSMLSRYGNIIERFKEVNIDAAFLGSFTGALAISQLGVEPIARPINEDGASTYCGYIFTRKNSGIASAADMKGKTFAFVEKATTAGYVFPLAYLRRHQVGSLDDYFKAYYFTGSHDGAIDAVLNGRADVGATKNTIYNFVRKTDPRLDSELTILATSPKVPSNGLCVKPEMASATKERLRQELLALHQSQEGLAVLKSLGFQRFGEASKADYAPVFALSEEAGINLEEYRYANE